MPDGLLCEFIVPGVPISAQTSNKARKQEWTAAVTAAAQGAWLKPPLDTKLAVSVTYFEPGTWKLDLDNMVKPILDAITGVVWIDDKQLVDIHPARRDLDGYFRIKGMSPVVAEGFIAGEPFIHVKVTTPPDQGVFI